MAALGILLRALRRRRSIEGPLRAAAASFADRDRRFLWMLTQETVRWQARLDAVLAPLLHHPIAHLDPPVRVLLRLAACQVCVLDQVPAHAIVDEGVRLAQRTASPGAAGLVNAVSRRLVADGKARWEEIGSRRAPEEWGIVHSHPSWLIDRWRRRWGDPQTLSVLRWDNEHPPVWLRALPREGVPAGGKPGWVPDTYKMPDRYRPSSDPGFQQGRWTAQDPSETLVVLLPPDGALGKVLDLCAAPGTKTTHLAVRYPRASVIALDRTRLRVGRLRESLLRTRVRAPILLGDALTPPFRMDRCEGVLVDAPCSALGVLRRRVDARWNVTPGDLRSHGRRQRRILQSAAALVQPGG